jgi:hypothetical protein
MFCYACGKEITPSNRSDEHIIPNAIGGRLKSKSLLCKQCNSDFGDSIDSELSRQLNHIGNMLNIKRDRGNPQPIKGIYNKTGEQIILEPGGKPSMPKPVITEEANGDKKCVHVTARSVGEAKTILKGLNKKYPKINVEETLKNAEMKRKYLDDEVHYSTDIGGEESFRSVCKTSVSFYMHTGGKREYIQDLIPYIKGDIEIDRVYFFYDEEVISKDNGQIIHGLVLRGNSREKVLYMYVEYFNAFKFLVLLNDNYQGVNVNESYVFDLLNQAEIEPAVTLNLTRARIIRAITEKTLPIEKMRESLNQIMPVILDKQRKEVISDFASRALENSLMKYPEGVLITEEMINELTREFMKEITPWLIHILKKNDD